MLFYFKISVTILRGLPPPLETPEAKPGATNGVDAAEQPGGITPETREKIITLANESIEAQNQAAEFLKQGNNSAALQPQTVSRDKLTTIQTLLPKQQDQQQQDQQDQEQDQSEEQQNQQESEQDQQQQEEEPQQASPEKEQDPELEDIRKLLEKAIEREREHEEEKRKRDDLIPLPPFERDW